MYFGNEHITATGNSGGLLPGRYNIAITVPSAPLVRPASVHSLLISLTLAPLQRMILHDSPDSLSAVGSLALAGDESDLISAIG